MTDEEKHARLKALGERKAQEAIESPAAVAGFRKLIGADKPMGWRRGRFDPADIKAQGKAYHKRNRERDW